MNLAVLWLFAKVFSVKFGGVTFFGVAKASNPQKFSPSMVSCYTVMHEGVLLQCGTYYWLVYTTHNMNYWLVPSQYEILAGTLTI